MAETHVALTSGGMDSAVAAHVAVRWADAELLVYLDTTTGTEANRRYVERLADHLGVQVWTLRTHKPYDEWVRDWEQFPGDGMHHVAYRRLKEAQLDKLYSIAETPLHLWTGIRARESNARMATAAPVEDDNRREERYWHNPIHDWSKRDCRRYVERFQLPRNYLWRSLGRSGDCYCGCYGTPEEILDLRAVGADRAADRLESLEGEISRDDERGRWAWSGMTEVEQRAERVDDQQMKLCSTCGTDYPVQTDGGHE
jgi:3'-phosphoadenosine 5'-phosphosulfate sulfotransferase (PAPS reductase)/FAD synthetase